MRLRELFLVPFLFNWFLCGTASADPYRPLDHLWRGTQDFGRTESLVLLGVGTAATIFAFSQDDKVKDFFDGKDRLGGLEKVGNFWGSGVPSGLLIGGFIGYGLLAKKDPLVQSGIAHLEAAVVSTAIVFGMKYTIARPRPNNGAKESFPSGHSSMAFSTAGNLWGMHGPLAGIPAVGMGVLTAASRLAVSMHYLSDVIAGATLGFVTGYAFSQHHLETKPPRVTFLPYFEDRSHFGFLVTVRGLD